MTNAVLYVVLAGLILSLFPSGIAGPVHVPGVHASFATLPHDFLPRKPSNGTLQPFPLSAPTGLASYGSGGNLSTDAVKGSVTFDSLNLGVDYIPPPYASTYTYLATGYSSQQLNAVLWIPGHGVYWTQNVVMIASNSTMSPEVELIDNIWNFTSVTGVMHGGYVRGNGTVASPGFYYYLDPVVYNLTFPFTVNLSMHLVSTNAGAVRVTFLYSIESGNGAVYSGVYDSVLLFPGSANAQAYYQIGSYAPLGLPSDLEYVLGGPGGGSFAVVRGISGSLSLYYASNGVFRPVPDAYSYGSDTAETVYFVTVGRDFSNPQDPQGSLGYGNLNTYQLWPITPLLEVSLETGISEMSVTGYLTYPSGPGSSYSAVQGQTVALRLGEGAGSSLTSTSANATAITSRAGAFTVTLPVDGTSSNELVVTYAGDTEFNPSYFVIQLAVSSLALRGLSSYTVDLNGVSVSLPGADSVYLATPLGSRISLTVPNLTQVAPGERELASVTVNGAAVSGQTVTLSGSLSANVTISGTLQYLVDTLERSAGGVVNDSRWYDAGSPLSLSAQEYIWTNSTSRYAFAGWTVDGNLVNSTSILLSVASPLVVSSVYLKQDLVRATSPLSNTSAWATVGEQYTLSAPPSFGNFLVSYGFRGWTGTYKDSANPLTFVVTRPVLVTAQYSVSYTGALLLLVVLFATGVGVGFLLRRGQSGRQPSAPKPPEPPEPPA